MGMGKDEKGRVMIRRFVVNPALVVVFFAALVALSRPFFAQVRVDAARDLAETQQWVPAEKCFIEALSLAPWSSEYWLAYGDFLWEMSAQTENMETFNKVAPAYARASSVNPRCALCRVKEGQIALATGRGNEAVDHFRRAKALDPRGGDTVSFLQEAGLDLLRGDGGNYGLLVELTGDFVNTPQGQQRVAEVLNPPAAQEGP